MACKVFATLTRSTTSSTLERRRHACRINEHEIALVLAKRHEDTIARRPGFFARDHTLIAQQAIHQRRLADVGAADDGDADGVRKFGLRIGAGSSPASTCSMSSSHPGRDLPQIAKASPIPERVEIGGGDGPDRAPPPC